MSFIRATLQAKKYYLTRDHHGTRIIAIYWYFYRRAD